MDDVSGSVMNAVIGRVMEFLQEKVQSEGGLYETRLLKQRGRYVDSSEAHDGSGNVATRIAYMGPRMTAKNGRTIALGNYEFARVNISMSFGYDPREHDRDEFMERAQAIVDEVLMREVACITGKKHVNSIEDMKSFRFFDILFGVEYGLTMSLPKMHSAKYDIGLVEPIDEFGDSLWEQIEAIQEWVAGRIAERRKKVMASKSDLGI